MIATNVRISFEIKPDDNAIEKMESIKNKINLLIEQNIEMFEGANPSLNYFDEDMDILD